MGNLHGRSIDTWHVCISGFMQDESRPTGIAKIWHDLHHDHTGPDTAVVLQMWSACEWTLAEWIWRLRPQGLDAPDPRILIYAYSWGGFTAFKLCRELANRNLGVESVVVADAVYRHWYRLGQWRAFVPWPIGIPANVRRVTAFYQRRNWPRGCELVIEDKRRTELTQTELHCTHQYADDAPLFYRAALLAAGEPTVRGDE